jgi:Xaa-Pro aminopeptidase
MKLQELDTLKQQDKAEQVLEDRLGYTVSFDNLSMYESRHMLMRVRGLLNEHRSSTAFHSSERDPAYLKLLMIESGLKGRLKEVAPVVPGQPAAAPGAVTAPATGTVAAKPGQPAAAPVNLKDPKLVAATKKSQSGQQLNPQEKEMMAAAGAAAVAMQKESRLGRRRLRESELQSAQVVLAAQDMIDRIQKMLEEVSEMQFKDLPALTDSIKNDMGIDQATQFQSASAAALTQLLQSLQQGKTQMEAAQGTLTGQAPVVPGQDPMAAPADPNMDPNMDAELDLDVDADIEPADDEEEPTPLGGAGLGRERR